ncbi:MAG TPA: nucleotidyltransferase family protein [Gemmatimonadaceae bacterium]|nr:nucleotidyltransferase family protein [Gemmatimonadaceae bacterium]
MSLRELILDTFAAGGDVDELGRRWGGVRMSGAAFTRLLSVEDCASDLLVRWRQLGIEARLPAFVRDEVTRRTHGDMARMLTVRVQLRELVDGFRKSGIEITLLKGAAFLASGMRQLRPFTDLDLLVPAAQVDAARALMSSLGYTSNDELAIQDHHHLPPFARRGSVPVELHLRTLHRDTAEAEVTASMPIEPGVRVLAPTEWCWHALAHEARHHDLAGRVRGALDVAALAERYADIDWGVIAQRSHQSVDHIGVVALSVLRIAPQLPLHVSAGARWRARCASYGRERAARGASSEKAFAAALYRIGMLALGTDRWEHRLDPPRAKGAAGRLVPARVSHLASLVAITLGREVS